MPKQISANSFTVRIENLGGIDENQFLFESGVTLLTGRNATNRTSLLRAINSALGGSAATLKSDADKGRVSLDISNKSYTRRFLRSNGSIKESGDPYTSKTIIVDNYCSLLKSNPSRRTIEQGNLEQLRDIILEPIDTENIQNQIQELNGDLQNIEKQIKKNKKLISQEPELEEKKSGIRQNIGRIEEKITDLTDTIDEHEMSIETVEEAETIIKDLQQEKQELERLQNEISTQNNAIESLHEEKKSFQEQLDQLESPVDEIEDLDEKLNQLQSNQREIDQKINSLLSVIEFNESVMDSHQHAGTHSSSDSIISELYPSSKQVECWTCGNIVNRKKVEDKIQDLRDILMEKHRESSKLEKEIEEIREGRLKLIDLKDERDKLTNQIEESNEEINSRKTRIERLQSQKNKVSAKIENLEQRASDTKGLRESDLLDHYSNLTQLEYNRGRLEQELTEIERKFQKVETTKDDLQNLKSQRKQITTQLESLRTRVEDIEKYAVDTFNDHIEEIVELLGYENIEKVWIERKVTDDTDILNQNSEFEIHVVRTTTEDKVYNDTIFNLSESEREIVGLVVALAGFLAHDVKETIPIMLLDSLEAIDAPRIEALIDYFSDYSEFLLVALLPEDAEGLADKYNEITLN